MGCWDLLILLLVFVSEEVTMDVISPAFLPPLLHSIQFYHRTSKLDLQVSSRQVRWTCLPDWRAFHLFLSLRIRTLSASDEHVSFSIVQTSLSHEHAIVPEFLNSSCAFASRVHVLVAAHTTVGFSEAAMLFLKVLHFVAMITFYFSPEN